jgi:hypothetical protein
MDDRGSAGAAGGSRTRAIVAGAVAVGLAAAAAVAAISASRSTGSEQAVDPGTAPPSSLAASPGIRAVPHGYPEGYKGPVWVTLASSAAADRDAEVAWGPWRRVLRPRRGGTVTYWFEKKDEVSVPLTVQVPDGVEVSFGEGQPDGAPAGAGGPRPRTTPWPPRRLAEPRP